VNSRNLFRLALAVVAAGYIGYARFTASHAPAPTSLAAMPIPPRAMEFNLGNLHFRACELAQEKTGATTSAFCTPFTVAENRAAPDARKINLRLALIRSDAVVADSDIVVLLAGGPGQSAVNVWPRVASAFAPLRRHHHILLLDQRGTGESNPLTCKLDKDRGGKEFDNLDPAVMRERTRACLAIVEKKADPRYYTTTDAVADLEEVRQALGAPQLDLIGASYGTRMGQQYLMRHPEGVRSAVFDSVAPNELVLGEDFAVNLESSLKAQFARCTQTPLCAKAYGDPFAALTTLREELRTKPQNYEFRDPLTFQPVKQRVDERVLVSLVRMFAYTPETAAVLPLSIAQALKGNLTPLAGQNEAMTDDMSELMDNGMQLSVLCSEDVDLLTPRPQDAGLVFGTTMIDGLKSACEIWPHGTRPADFHTPLKSDKPVLVLEGELDPVTPPRYGEALMQGLSNARLIVAKGQGHSIMGRGCLPKIVDEFIAKLAPKTLDTKCVEAFGPMPAYVDFNGSSP
jgi:pimeloyl-ACP methyl ester carboxylesterase